MQGKYEEAEALLERSQRIMEAILGAEHPALAKMLNNQAAFLMDQVGGARRLRFLYQQE